MTRRPGPRFLVEALYLLGLAAALAFSDLGAYAIVGAMALGWLLVVAIEWAAFRSVPHFAAGDPPRWYVPRVDLPPARPLEQLSASYPEAQRDEAVTWIAPAELRAELLGDWPLALPPEDTQESPPPEPWVEPAPEPVEAVSTVPVEAASEPEPPRMETVSTVPVETVSGPELEPEPEPVETVSARSAETVSGPEPKPKPVETVSARSAETVSDPAPQPALARYHLDPLAEPERRRFRRRVVDDAIEVPARPSGPRPLPPWARDDRERA
ncbi:MAG TPA: hypothetical protein VFA19_16145 [Gaiellaceae bacterium]|nr:hypothetical protein [Gaiellaceae bacterium]